MQSVEHPVSKAGPRGSEPLPPYHGSGSMLAAPGLRGDNAAASRLRALPETVVVKHSVPQSRSTAGPEAGRRRTDPYVTASTRRGGTGACGPFMKTLRNIWLWISLAWIVLSEAFKFQVRRWR